MFLKGILIGLIFGVPVGAVGAMTVQRTWEHGIKAGLLTGMGSSIADCIYAAIGAFGLTIISDFLLQYQTAIHLVGGTIVLFMGIRLLFRKGEAAEVTVVSGKVRMFLSSFVIGITNPAVILTFLFAFSWFGIAVDNTKASGWLVVLGVFGGTYLVSGSWSPKQCWVWVPSDGVSRKSNKALVGCATCFVPPLHKQIWQAGNHCR